MTTARRRRLAALVVVLTATTITARAEAPSGWSDGSTGLAVDAPNSGYGPAFALDPQGRPRVVFLATDGSVSFGWCDNACDRASAWKAVVVDARAAHEPTYAQMDFQLEIDGRGRPHLAWRDYADDTVKYATCSERCDDAGSWHVAVAARTDTSCSQCGSYGGIGVGVAVPVTMALDPQGRPAIVHTDGGDTTLLYYAQCATACGDASSWQRVLLENSSQTGFKAAHPDLAFYGTTAVVSFKRVDGAEKPLRVKSCAADCLTGASWKTHSLEEVRGPLTPLFVADQARAATTYVVQTTTSDRPVHDHWLAYTECSASCLDPSKWSQSIVFDNVGDRFNAADYVMWRSGRHYHHATAVSPLLVDGRPRIVYSSCVDCGTTTEQEHLFLATCTSGCASRASWSVEHLLFAGSFAENGDLAQHNDAYHLMYTRRETKDGTQSLHYATCRTGCWAASTSSTSTSTTTTTTTTTTSTTTTSTTTAPSTTTTTSPSPTSPTVDAAPSLSAPIHHGTFTFGEPSKFKVVATSSEGHPYRAQIVVRNVASGASVQFETPISPSGLAATGSPPGPLPDGNYEWTARAVDSLGRIGPWASPWRFAVRSS